jgi:hypothetical protein
MQRLLQFFLFCSLSFGTRVAALWAQDLDLHGTIGHQQADSYALVPFEVPPGTTPAAKTTPRSISARSIRNAFAAGVATPSSSTGQRVRTTCITARSLLRWISFPLEAGPNEELWRTGSAR